MPCLGVPDDELNRSLQGRVGMGQRTRRKSFIEPVNHWRSQDSGCVRTEMHRSNYCSISLGI